MRIVGIGASAGGLEAIRSLLESAGGLRGASDLAWVVVVHLDPTHDSALAENLQASTQMPVVQVTGPTQLVAGHVFVIAPGHGLVLERELLRVEPLPERATRAPIDRFFDTLAAEKGADAAVVVLSGLGTDGTDGALRVHRAGGLVLVQSPADARFDGMPRSAVASGAASVEGTAPELADALCSWARGEAPQAPRLVEEESPDVGNQALLERIFEVVRRETGHDFSGYRPASLTRRIQHRMAAISVRDLESYVARLEQQPEEAHRLLADLMVSVTRFFRDPESFEALASTVIPAVLEGRDRELPIRIWVPGCATGEEAYSLAILFSERLSALASPPDLQIFGTDIDKAALDVARRGTYPAGIAQHITEDRLKRFFTAADGGWQIASHIRSKCVFSEHDVVRDPPFSKLDLVSCRNVLIYLGADAKDRILEILHYGLAPKGFLFLGPAETVPRDAPYFEAIDAKHRIFRKTAVSLGRGSVYGLRGPPASRFDIRFAPLSRPTHGRLIRQVERTLLEDLAPPSVVVDARHRVLFFVGQTNPYLGPPAGSAPTDQLLELTKRSLRPALREALHAAAEARGEARRTARISEDSPSAVEIIVQPLRLPDTAEPVLLVTFRDAATGMGEIPASVPREEPSRALESELRETRAQLEVTVGELEGSNEELKDANDELLSMNEELQSANEELQTSKEELQSMNEELRTLNQELAQKIEALDRANADMRNLFASTDVATLFLDRELRINRFTPRATKLFRFIESDRGRPIADIAARFRPNELVDASRNVLATLEPFEVHVSSLDGGNWYVARVHPYRTLDDLVDGVVITFIDVTDLKREIAEREAAEREFRAIFEAEAAGNAEIELPGGRLLRCNASFAALAGAADEAALVGTQLVQLAVSEDRGALGQLLVNLAANRRGAPIIELRFRRADGRIVWVQLSGAHVDGAVDGATRGVVVAIDVTQRHELEETLLHARKVEAVGRLAGGIAHDFNNLLAVAVGHLEIIQLEHPEQHDLDPHVQAIHDALERAADLTQQLLTFARRQAIEPRAIRPSDLVRKTERMLRRVIGANVELVVRAENDAAAIRADPAQVEQMLLNLVINARDAMPSGGRIEIDVANETLDARRLSGIPDVSPGDYVRFSVRDTGTGMDADTLAHCLDPFFTTKPVRKGTGLGLSSVYGTARQSGGFLEIESRVDRGTTARIYFPQSAETVPPPQREPTATGTIGRPEGGGETILLVEDEPALLSLNRDALTSYGYRVITAENGAQALDRVREHTGPIHIVVTDVVMPILGGRELARGLRDVRPEVPVLFVSGHVGSALPAGAAFLAKPFTPRTLAHRVRAEIDAHPLPRASAAS